MRFETHDHRRITAYWKRHRRGAQTGRGFHFQDAVAAWIASWHAAGGLPGEAVVPEGAEDVSVEGELGLDIQVKSRTQKRGPFAAGEAARLCLDVFSRYIERGRPPGKLAVVFENGVRDESLDQDFNRSIGEVLGPDSGLRITIEEEARKIEMTTDDLIDLFARMCAVGVTWDEITAFTKREVSVLVDLPPLALQFVVHELRWLAAECADRNGDPSWSDRERLTRSDISATVNRMAEQMDIDSLETAIRSGACEPLDLSVSVPAGDSYYEGISTQPYHVASDLVVHRSDVLNDVTRGLEANRTVLLVGPSGVGKSAVLWTVPRALPGVLWFRVSRLRDCDVVPLLRLARAYGAQPDAPLGFLVDAVGLGETQGWEALSQEVAALPGVHLVGSARFEDLFVLDDLSDCVQVAVTLDEEAAETIFGGLRRRGVTSVPHWREAFLRADGLTMEFTHILTQGRRLTEVVSQQVQSRIRLGRQVELDLLALAAVAHRWSANLSVEALIDEMETSQPVFRAAIARLEREHLLVERDGQIVGLHQLRSAAIAEAIHRTPPPLISSTVERVLSVADTSLLQRFIASLLRDEPSLSRVVTHSASSTQTDLPRLTGFLSGVRLADFVALGQKWIKIAAARKIPITARLLLFHYAAMGLNFPDSFSEQLRSTLKAIKRVSAPSDHRQSLINALVPETIGLLIASCTDAVDVARFFAALEGSEHSFDDAIAVALDSLSPFGQTIKQLPPQELGDLVSAVASGNPRIAEHIIEIAGGQAKVLAAIREADPWLTELGILNKDRRRIGRARLLHVSDHVADANKRAIEVGRLLLRCLPTLTEVDVKSLAPGGQEIRHGDSIHGTTDLKRQYDHPKLRLSWNQTMIRTVRSLFGASNTDRLHQAVPLLNEASMLTKEIATRLALGERIKPDLDLRVSNLHRHSIRIPPPVLGVELADTLLDDVRDSITGDDLSGLLTNLTGNMYDRLGKREGYRKLAKFIEKTVKAGSLEGAASEPWHIIDQGNHPESLDKLRDILTDLQSLVWELSYENADVAKIHRTARTGSRSEALSRAASECRRSTIRRSNNRRRSLHRAVARAWPGCRPVAEQGVSPSADWLHLGFAVEVDTLFQWSEALETLNGTLEAVSVPGDEYVLIPIRNERPVSALACKKISGLWPTDDIDWMLTKLPTKHHTNMHNMLQQLQTALQTLSGLCELSDGAARHPSVIELEHQLEEHVKTALTELGKLPEDDVVTAVKYEVLEWLKRVSAEQDETSLHPNWAQQLWSGLLGTPNKDWETVLVANTYALEWDIDPANAVQLLQD